MIMNVLGKLVLGVSILTYSGAQSTAQIRVNNPGRVVERQAENRANTKIDQAVDKGLDAVETGVINLFRKKNESKTGSEPEKKGSTTAATQNNETDKPEAVKTDKQSLKSYSKFDFIAGDKIVALEDFSQDAVGDFPAKWNTNSSGEIVTLDGTEGKWLMLGPEGVFYPEFIEKLPENFTLEFNLASTTEFSFYSGFMRLVFAETTNPAKDFVKWNRFDHEKAKGLEVGLHPQGADASQGMTFFNTFTDTPSESLMKNEKSFPAFHAPNHNVVKVSVWRQKTRLRLYVDDYKVWDLPRAFNAQANYNLLAFSNGGYHDPQDKYFISDVRLAAGLPDTRNKLITEGKFSTTGILFDINSAIIKPASYGVLKELSAVLIENPALKVKIIGHTDSDGADGENLSLSKRRSEAVKAALTQEFGIDKLRMETDGKGETDPVAPNSTAEGKANNRRVEFIRL